MAEVAYIRYQGGDFQDSGFQGNISKLENLISKANESANNGKNVSGIDIVGDFFDAHLLTGETQESMEFINWFSSVVDNEYSKIDSEKFNRIKEIEKTYTDIEASPQEKYKGIIEEIKDDEEMMNFFNHYMDDKKDPVALFYQLQLNTIHQFNENNIKIYGVHGNNDTNRLSQILKDFVTFTDSEDTPIFKDENNPFSIIGANNTFEYAFPKQLRQIYDDNESIDDSVAYQNHNLEATDGKKANIIQLHGPPNKEGMRAHMSETPGKGVDALIDEHKPSLVECGHVHGGYEFVTDGDGTTYARSSNNFFFEHEFDKKGTYLRTKIFKYDDVEDEKYVA